MMLADPLPQNGRDERDEPESGTPWLFDAVGLVGAIVVLLVALQASQPALAILAAAVVVLGLIARLWARFALHRLRYDRLLSETRAFPGETVTLTLRLDNAKVLPLAWVHLREQVPESLAPAHGQRIVPGSTGDFWAHKAGSLLWYRRALWRETLRPQARGIYAIGPARIRTGDPFGLFTRELSIPSGAPLVVYPRVVPLRRLALPIAHPDLSVRARQAIIEDPSRQAGVRDYRPGDSLRRIHWRASARTADLKVRLLEPSTARELALFLAMDGFDHPWQVYQDVLFEQAISALASIAVFAAGRDEPVGFYANEAHPVVIPPSSNGAQAMRILESMARLRPEAGPPLSEFVAHALRRLHRGSAIVVAAAAVPADLAEVLVRARRSGHAVTLLSMTPHADDLPNLPLHAVHIPPYGDIGPILEGAR